MSRRSSLSNVLMARRPSLGGATPNLATPSAGPLTNRRGSLKDLAAHREALHRAASEHEQALDKHRRAVRQLLQAHTVAELDRSVPSERLIDIEGTTHPVAAFDILLNNNIEAAPVYTLRRAGDLPPGLARSPSHTRTTSAVFSLPPVSPLSRRAPQLPRALSPTPNPLSGSGIGSGIGSGSGTGIAGSLSPAPVPTAPLSPSPYGRALSPAPSTASVDGAASSTNPNALVKDYTGFLDVRDLVSSVILLHTQPVNEDELVFTAQGPEVPAVADTHGLDGLVSLERHEELVPAPLAAMREEPASFVLSPSGPSSQSSSANNSGAHAAVAPEVITPQSLNGNGHGNGGEAVAPLAVTVTTTLDPAASDAAAGANTSAGSTNAAADASDIFPEALLARIPSLGAVAAAAGNSPLSVPVKALAAVAAVEHAPTADAAAAAEEALAAAGAIDIPCSPPPTRTRRDSLTVPPDASPAQSQCAKTRRVDPPSPASLSPRAAAAAATAAAAAAAAAGVAGAGRLSPRASPRMNPRLSPSLGHGHGLGVAMGAPPGHTHNQWEAAVGAGISRFLPKSPANSSQAGAVAGGNVNSAAAGGAISVTYLSRRNPFRAVRMSSSLLEVAELLARGSHRVPVVAADGTVVDIISQAALIRFLLANAATQSEFAEMLNVRVADMDLGSRDVITVSTSQTALDAFQRMDEVRLSGLAIVDDDGRFVASTSSRDMKRFALDKGRMALSMPVLDYLTAARTAAAAAAGAPAPAAMAAADGDVTASTLPEGSTVLEVLQALAQAGTNRAFLVDEDNVPMRVVALADIARLASGH